MSLGGRGTHASSTTVQSAKITSFFKRSAPALPPHALPPHASESEEVKWKPSPAKRQRRAADEAANEQPSDAIPIPQQASSPTLLSLLTEPSWVTALDAELKSPSFKRLEDFVAVEMSSKTIFPPRPDVFRAFNQTPITKVKVCIIGQDPYHGPGQAMGLSFSVPKTQPVPSSLRNIYKEISSDLGHPMQSFSHGDLSSWCSQGVLLLNAVLTVRSGEPASHQKKGWEELTDGAIRALSREREGIVFLLWGKFAQEKAKLIDLKRGHKVLKAAHPSGLSASRGFFGCKHFSQANGLLAEPIDWRVS